MVDLMKPATPSSRVSARKQVFDEYLDLDPAQRAQQRREREGLKTQAMRETFGAVTGAPGPGGKIQAAQIGAQAQQAAAQQMPQHAMALQQQAATGAGMEQDIAQAEAKQSLQNVQAGLQRGSADYARAIAQQAFDAGLDAKAAIFHENAAFADEAFKKMAADFEAGRISRKEVAQVARGIQQRLTERQQAADEALSDALARFRAAMKEGNAERERGRVLRALDIKRQALEDAARAQQIAGILTGSLKVLGAAKAASG